MFIAVAFPFLNICPLLIFLHVQKISGDDCITRPIELLGAGSSFPATLYNDLAPKYIAERGQYERKVKYKFIRVNSGYARDRITMKWPEMGPVAFGASEGELSYEQKRRNPLLKTFPTLAGAVVIVYNVPEVEAAGSRLVLSVDVLPKIYDGTIIQWDHSEITATNDNITFPSSKIRVVARSDNSGDTGIFTDALGRFQQNWLTKYGQGFSNPEFDDSGKSQKWPPGVVEFWAKQATGMAGIVASIPYTIGYVALPNAEEVKEVGSRLVYAKLINKMGLIAEPDEQGLQAAMDYFHYLRPNSLAMKLNNALLPKAYPLASFSYFIVNSSSHERMDCCSVQELVGFADFIINKDNSDIFKLHHLVPLSRNVKKTVTKLGIRTIDCKENDMYGKYIESMQKKTEFQPWMVILPVIGVIFLAIFIIGGVYAYYMRREQLAKENKWLISEGRIRIQNNNNNERSISRNSSGMSSRHNSMRSSQPSIIATSVQGTVLQVPQGAYASPAETMNPYEMAEYDHITVMLESLGETNPSHWDRDTKVLVNRMREEIDDENVLNLIGITWIQSVAYVVFEEASKGTLHNVLQTSRYYLNESINYNMALDVAKGLSFLHRRQVSHGMLSSITCFVNSRWMVKIGGWERFSLLSKENVRQLNTDILDYKQDMDMKSVIQMLYIDPEVLNSNNRMNADVYSFGILLCEIFTRKTPFSEEVEDGIFTYSAIVASKCFDGPRIPKLSPDKVPPAVKEMVNFCTGHSKNRPNIDDVFRMLNKVKPTHKGVVDVMMDTMEKYMENLEQKVEERTEEIKTVTDRVQELLHEVLPPSIATQLFNGDSVEPEYFECVSVYFSDIVGFTTISSKSKPIQSGFLWFISLFHVMQFLNDLWTAFDSIIELFDVYKVDTIGDAYFVCSGLPQRNGNDHVKQIADLAFALLAKCSMFKIHHMPDDTLRIRIGLHSGPATAGVVGMKMPQYCVFGETINTAMTMESSSEALRIHMSEATYELLNEHFPQYEMTHRGVQDVQVKRHLVY